MLYSRAWQDSPVYGYTTLSHSIEFSGKPMGRRCCEQFTP